MDDEMLGRMAANIENIQKDQADTKVSIGKIFTVIDGLVPKVAVIESKQKSMPSPRKMMTASGIWAGLAAAITVIGLKLFGK